MAGQPERRAEPEKSSYHYLISDHLGTPQQAINSTGEQSWKINSDAFGNTNWTQTTRSP
jgi:hypothetical protein